jgi:Asp-tRNA(Asn)/Glu-tRNA(Gln) amidotransferase A subunit family amidase
MYLARLKRLGPRLLCVVTLTEERALAQAERADREIAAGRWRGPLHGIPWGAKDLLATRGVPTTYGAKPFETQMLDEDAAVVRRLDEAGAVLVAKLSMGELAMGDQWFGGKTRSPWDPRRGSSGSSAGSASAAAAGLVGFAIGSETLGSIVSPSVANGVTGLRPTYGRVPRTGAMALSWTMDKLGPMCRGVEGCAAVLHAIHGADGRDATAARGIPFRWEPRSDLKKLRVGIDEASFAEARKKPAWAKISDEVLGVLGTLGVTPVPVRLPPWNPAYDAVVGTLIDVEGAASFARLTASGGLDQLAQQEEWNWPNVFRSAALVSAVDYVQALRVRTHLQRAMAESLRDVDVYVTVPFRGPSLVYTKHAGHPTVVTRCGRSDEGLPESIEFTGAPYREDAALRLAFAFEQATPRHRDRPDTEQLSETPPPLLPRKQE